MKKSYVAMCMISWLLVAQPSYAALFSTAKANGVFSYQHVAAKQGQRKKISSSQAASIVKAQYGGKILKVKGTSSGYRVKVLKGDGRISSVFVDGQTGRIKR